MKYLKQVGIGLLILGVLFASAFFIKSNSKSSIVYEIETLKIETIEEKIVATGKVLPEDEVNVVPQIAGIIEEIFLSLIHI